MLSSFADMPINQGVAVTGSVNQMGEIQPIGGVNEKIEGFFDVCKSQGLNGSQGVMIPHQNEQHLMLRPDIVEAVKKGKFHVYSVKTIDDGIEVLTGLKAGKISKSGTYPENSVHGKVHRKLKRMALDLITFGAEEEAEEKEIGKEAIQKKKPKKKAKKKSKKKSKR